MTNQNIVDARYPALRRFGYTGRESQFLCMAALHSGYFLRRQYCKFIDRSVGGTAASLVEKVLGNKHAFVAPGYYGTKVYHLASRPFFAALGEENNRNRRERQPDAIKLRLVVLDFVIAHPGIRFLVTEREKTDYFTQERGIDAAILPAKGFGAPNVAPSVHAFPDRYPIYLREIPDGGRPIPTFCFVDEGLAGVSRFESYLASYGQLIGALKESRVEYVATGPHNFAAAREAFDRFQGGHTDTQRRRVAAYFQNRLLFEQQGVGAFDRAKFLEFRDQRQALSGIETDAQFEAWRTEHRPSEPESDSETRANAHFATFVLEENYNLFGSLARVSSHAS